MNVVVTGATGLLGGWVVAALTERGDRVVAFGGPGRGEGAIDLAEPRAAARALEDARADVVIHTAALSAMSDCARDPERARRINVDATANLARACAATRTRLVHVSTDLVFDGERAPYDEAARAEPTSVYGRTKLESESAALAAPNGAVVRVSLLFGPSKNDRVGFFDTQVRALRAGTELRLFDDEWRTPLSLRTAAEGLRAIAASSFTGLLHFAGAERIGRWEMGVVLADVLGVEASAIVRASRREVPGEPRPRDVSLDVSLFRRTFPGVELAPFGEECRRLIGRS
ncbi:MAG: SDR family oxidoreductase [Labilithrix sp.]|nr:SDR family oxidoreductase [Labilithrix sp.]MCW5809932.1 SDR family oxidoreductase [Labilithrix sp.]